MKKTAQANKIVTEGENENAGDRGRADAEGPKLSMKLGI